MSVWPVEDDTLAKDLAIIETPIVQTYNPDDDDIQSVVSEISVNSWIEAQQVPTRPLEFPLQLFMNELHQFRQDEPYWAERVACSLIEQCDLYVQEEPLLNDATLMYEHSQGQRFLDWGLSFFETPTRGQIHRLFDACQDFIHHVS